MKPIGWERWFAWHSVQTVEKKWIWFRHTWRFWETIWDGYWVYSDMPDYTSGIFANTLNEDGTKKGRP
ncbi:hypothetical protein LCGC14_0874120 [marine sediment metagenome]|uniref:Uncharacterized protein n=1 Tax=marine sediment metagenome TaxID=412755 RepID=A0A0F9RNG1_9ZZZZ